MKKLATLLLAFILLCSNSSIAQDRKSNYLSAQQVSKLDVSGKWVGKRKQYSWDKKSFIEIFEYEFDLKQEGNVISGTSTILSSNGEYADMQIEGVLIGNKLIFAEKQVLSAIRPEGKLWCFKHGELFFQKDGNMLKMLGATGSSMETYNYPCSGGETILVKADNRTNASLLISDFETAPTHVDEKIDVGVFPNPFIETANISYSLPEAARVSVEVFDMNGRLVTSLFEGNQKPGFYLHTFNAVNSGFMTGLFIVKLTMNGEVFSRQIVQMR